MYIHPSTLQLSKRLNVFLLIPGLVALATYLATVSSGACIGYSSTLIAASVGLLPASGADHPVFAGILHALAIKPLFSLPVTLNLFSALCGAGCAVLLYHFVSHLVLVLTCETDGGSTRVDNRKRTSVLELPSELAQHNRRIVPLAIAGGLIAATLLTFLAPHWSASTQANPAPFDLLLAIAAFDALFMCESVSRTYGRILILSLSCLLFTVGLFESVLFLLLVPCYLFFCGVSFYFSQRKKIFLIAVPIGGLIGFAVAVLAFFKNQDGPIPSDMAAFVSKVFFGFAVHHYHEILSFYPKTAWFWLLAQTLLPVLLLLFGTSSLFDERRRDRLSTLLLLTLSSTPVLLNLPFSPKHLLPNDVCLSVFGAALTATATAFVIVATLKMILFRSPVRSEGKTVKGQVFSVKNYSATVIRYIGIFFLAAMSLASVLVPWRNFCDADARPHALADAIARDLIGLMGDRTCLVSNGFLDNHLLIQAHLLRHPLILVRIRPRNHPEEIRRLNDSVASDAIFADQNRIRLQNALLIGTTHFVTEWFKANPKVTERAMVLASPDVWTACGYRAVPEGLAFGGVLRTATPDVAKLLEQNRSFTEKMAPFFAENDGDPAPVASLRTIVRARASLSENELGVLLEELNRTEDAYQAYMRATRLDPMNMSAAVNGYVLTTSLKIHPEEVDGLRKKIKACAANKTIKDMPFETLLQTYGTIRQPDFYRRQIATWANVGAPLAAADKIAKASSLGDPNAKKGATSLADDAVRYLQAGLPDRADACCRAILQKDPSNIEALTTLATVSLGNRKLDEAETWLSKALRAGAKESDVLHQTIVLAMLRNRMEQAQSLLEHATKKYPSEVRYWILLAEVLLRQNATQEVEFKVLPAMQKALNTPNHYLIHAVRGFLLQKKGPSNYKAARLELLQALSENAMMPDAWAIVFEVDLALGNQEFIEADAKNQLAVTPDHALANYLLGSILLGRGELTRAEDFLRRSIEKCPTALACNDLAEDLRLQKRLPEAETFVRQALHLQTQLPAALDTQACILLDEQRADEAAPYAEQASKLNPASPAFRITLLRVRIQQKNGTEAGRLADEIRAKKVSIPEPLQKELKLLLRGPGSSAQTKS